MPTLRKQPEGSNHTGQIKVVTTDGANLFQSGAIPVPPAAPSAGQILVATSSTAASWDDRLPTLGTVVDATNGGADDLTSIDFTGIPSWVTSITIMFVGLSTNGTSNKLIQIGDTDGIEATGYLGASTGLGASVSSTSFTAGFGIRSGVAAHVLHGSITLSLENPTSNTWVASGLIARSESAATYTVAGSKSLTATLDRVRMTTVNGTDTFDAGSINIQYR